MAKLSVLGDIICLGSTDLQITSPRAESFAKRIASTMFNLPYVSPFIPSLDQFAKLFALFAGRFWAMAALKLRSSIILMHSLRFSAPIAQNQLRIKSK
ncbi:hypothetical protein DB346_18380 [Verrucomicrobia bacterium LW23]|nr:hypothetical protein DB346_18380 [Verrucomicrobia bacterium LW23]